MKSVLILLLSTISLFAFGQGNIPQFGMITNEEKNLKVCSFDKSAGAIILFDVAQSNYDEEHALITTRRIKYKILKESGLEFANVVIYYDAREEYENVVEVEAVVHTIDDKGIPYTIPLDKKSIYRNKPTDYYGEVKFALPGVKVGSIFEYSYKSVKKHWGGLSDWYFQRELPTLYSKYDLSILPGAAFQYKITKSPALSIDVQSPKNEGKISFAMENIPGLREEPYMDAPKDYIQRVEFQIAEYMTYYGVKRKVMNTWEVLNRELLSDPDFGRLMEKSLGKDVEILKQVSTLSTELEKMKAIHNYVRRNFTWNGRHNLYAREGIKKVWEKKSGGGAEINLTLINLLREAGLNTDALLVSERDHGKVNSSYPFLDQFNKVVAYVTIAGKSYVLDGTETATPSTMIPISLLNTNAFLLNRKNPTMIELKAENKVLKSILTANSELSEDGTITGKAYEKAFDYLKMDKTYYIKKDGLEGFAKKFILKEGSDMSIDSLSADNPENESLPLELKYNFKLSTSSSGGYRMIGLNTFIGFDGNPFVADLRFTNIDFGAPIDHTVTQAIKIPAGMKPDALPKNITLVMPDKSISLSRVSSYDDRTNVIVIRHKLDVTKPVFTAEEYPSIKEFYKKMMDIFKEQLVLKAK